MERACLITGHLCSGSDAQVLSEDVGNGVRKIVLNRTTALNSFNTAFVKEIRRQLFCAEQDSNIRVIVLTGSPKAFAAGADIAEMSSRPNMLAIKEAGLVDELGSLVDGISKPVIAAVRGYALGGGCEVAMACDIIIAGESAKFGQPEIKLGTIPGAGGTQRLTRVVGKSLAMEMCLSGNMINADVALRSGLASRVVPDDQVVDTAIQLASQIASMSRPIVAICKESVNRSYESSLNEGILFERRAFQSTFSTDDRKEGMDAFVKKRKPHWMHK